MKPIDYVLIFAVALTVLVGCAQAQAAQVEGVSSSGGSADAESSFRGSESAILLALGTLKLEDTGSAVTPAEAVELLPLWRTIAGGSLRSDAETNAMLTQIEGAMSGPQLAAINAMELEYGDVQVWMQEQGIAMPAPPAGQGNSSGPGALENLSEEERAKMRQEFQNVTAEGRATRMVSPSTEARGIKRLEGGAGAEPGGGPGGPIALLGYLVEFLTERAAG